VAGLIGLSRGDVLRHAVVAGLRIAKVWSGLLNGHGVELDSLLRKRRDKAAAKRFFKGVLRSNPVTHKVVTDELEAIRRPQQKFRN
jgi:transposase-like protein